MKRKDLFMGSTEISVQRTIGEIQSYLVRMGALQVLTTFDPKTQEPIGLAFTVDIDGMQVPFKMPARIEPIYKIIYGDGRQRDPARDMAQAKRVAWRQLYRWVQAQLALVETGMVRPEEVFFAYLQVNSTQTVYERAVTAGLGRLALPEHAETQPR